MSALYSHCLGCNYPTPKWLRDQVDDASGPPQVCHSAASPAMPTDTHTYRERAGQGERMEKGRTQKIETQPRSSTVTTD